MSPNRSRPARPSLAARRMRVRRAARVAVLGVGALVAGGVTAYDQGPDPFAPRARFQTVLDTVVLYGYGAGSPLLPSAFDLFAARTVVPGLSVAAVPNFDFAVVVNAQGQVVLYPTKTLVSVPPGVQAPRTGFQLSTTDFAALERAPDGTYRFDSTFVEPIGRTVAIEAQGVNPAGVACGQNSPLFAKLVVDSVQRATSIVHFRVHVNPNCGFRSFASGVPTD